MFKSNKTLMQSQVWKTLHVFVSYYKLTVYGHMPHSPLFLFRLRLSWLNHMFHLVAEFIACQDS